MKSLDSLLARLPPGAAIWLHRAFCFALGLTAAVILHYMLFRIALPSKPFIYVAF